MSLFSDVSEGYKNINTIYERRLKRWLWLWLPLLAFKRLWPMAREKYQQSKVKK